MLRLGAAGFTYETIFSKRFQYQLRCQCNNLTRLAWYSGGAGNLDIGDGPAPGADALLALTHDGSNSLKVYLIEAGGTQSNSASRGTLDAGANPLSWGTQVMAGGGAGSNGIGSSGTDGRLYWGAVFPAELSQSDLEDLFDGSKHPKDDFSPDLYFYCHDFTGAEYDLNTCEEGGWTLDIEGTPVHTT